jgi:ABC-2 type transport system ATP-binding protein
MSELVATEGLYRYYGNLCAVHDLNFFLERGEILGFLGPNGAGKSTSMQMIAGNLSPSRGQIRLNGVDLLRQPLRAKSALGFLPENPPLYRDMLVDEYLEYCARLHRIPGRDVPQAAQKAKKRCGLDASGKRLIGNLSKGYQQRVGIAQAIIHNPAVVILDEPTVGLDPIQIREIRDLIRELGESHGVILSTHILPEVQSLCSRVQIMHEGRLVFSNTLDALDADVGPARVTVQLENSPEPGRMLECASVQHAEALGDRRFRLSLAHRTDTSRLAREIVDRGWGLCEMTPERATLEQIFVDLTSGESGPVNAI